MNSFYGEIKMFSTTFAPMSWVLCNGQLYSIAQFQALYAVIGNYYGGNGTTNFAVPNLMGKVPMHYGSTPTFYSSYAHSYGNSTAVVYLQDLPSHTHQMSAVLDDGIAGTTVTTKDLLGSTLKATGKNRNVPFYTTDETEQDLEQMSSMAVYPACGEVGIGVLAHENNQPYLNINFCICLEGDIFPNRS